VTSSPTRASARPRGWKLGDELAHARLGEAARLEGAVHRRAQVLVHRAVVDLNRLAEELPHPRRVAEHLRVGDLVAEERDRLFRRIGELPDPEAGVPVVERADLPLRFAHEAQRVDGERGHVAEDGEAAGRDGNAVPRFDAAGQRIEAAPQVERAGRRMGSHGADHGAQQEQCRARGGPSG
jgi:hypothetical protein